MTPPEDSSLATPEDRALAVPDGDLRVQRWQLVRDLAVFQFKLLVDGLKDIVLAPIAFVAALIGLLTAREDPGRTFYSILRLGHGFDRWLNLFGTPDRTALPPEGGEPSAPTPVPTSQQGVDSYIDRVEQVLVEQVRRGGLTAKAKDAIDKALDTLHERPRPPRG